MTLRSNPLSRTDSVFPTKAVLSGLAILGMLLLGGSPPCAGEQTSARDGDESHPFALGQIQGNRFSMLEPNFFIFGGTWDDGGGALVPTSDQVRFKIALAYKVTGAPDNHTGFYAAITQDAYWNLFDESAPFYDTNFLPEFFYRHDIRKLTGNGSWFLPSGVKGGIRHHSNGKIGENSKGWNRLFLTTEFGDPNEQIFAHISFWGAWNVSQYNPNIEDYLGRGELRLDITPTWERGRRTLGEMGLSLRMPFWGKRLFPACEISLYVGVLEKYVEWFAPSLMIQFFDGFGYTLLDYDQAVRGIRVGLAAVRR
jgi:outer membrane phospholipase A